MNTVNAAEIVSHFGMLPHPEGGFYKETYRCAQRVPHAALPEGYSGDRSFCTAIMFMLRQGEYSHLHRIRQDEIWHYHLGGPLRLVVIPPDGKAYEVMLGPDLAQGQVLQYAVPGGSWFGATPAPGSAYTLVGCTVSPGFDFEDFELAGPELEKAFPAMGALIREFTLQA